MLTPRSLVLMKEGKTITIDDNNFESLQEILKMVFCTKTGPMDQQSFNPSGDKAKEIAEKLAEILGDTKDNILAKLTKSVSSITLASKVDEETANNALNEYKQRCKDRHRQIQKWYDTQEPFLMKTLKK